MFLTKDELKTVSTVQLIDKLTAQDDDIVDTIIAESIALMSSYLAKYYDVGLIFSATAENRHLNVLKKLKDIVIYELYERHTREQNKVAQRRYEEAMNWLEKLNTGEFRDATLPTPPEPDDITDIQPDTIRYGGNTRYSSIY